MIIARENFADIYAELFNSMKDHKVNFNCRGKSICYELLNAQFIFNPIKNGISIFSHGSTRAFPIRFALAEFIWIMAKSNDLDFINTYNKSMGMFSDDGYILYGAYGYRLGSQIEHCIIKLLEDKYSRQAFASIYDSKDISAKTKDMPCNTSLQFMIRNNELILTVNSRSSDFITGLPIDAFHWQLLLVLVYNELRAKKYTELTSGRVVYNIASLHIYSTDKESFDMFEFYKRLDIESGVPYAPYAHALYISKTYSAIVEASRNYVSDWFATDLDKNEIFHVIDFIPKSQLMLLDLHNIFISRKHRFNR